MMILTLRTDKPEAELALYQDEKRIAELTWLAHRQLGTTIHHKLQELLEVNQATLQAIDGIVAFRGPGSFTGLRIGLSVANALADGLEIPVVGSGGADWQQLGIKRLKAGEHDAVALPEYGAPVHITTPKH